MDVRLSAEQLTLRDSAAQMVDRLGPGTVRGLDDTARAGRLDAAVAASGWRELRVPVDGRSPLASGVEVAVVAEELGRGLADTSFLGPTLAVELRRLAGAPPSATVETVALTPSLATLATVGGEGLPPGTVAVDARGASAALVLMPDGAGHALATVAIGPVEVGTDLTRPGAGVDPAAISPVEGPDTRAVTDDELCSWTAFGLALDCADLVGTMRGAIDLAVGYACARHQFGRPIGSFQAIQHLLADGFVLMEGSRSIALHAAWAVDALDADADAALAAAAVAKAYCARSARTVCETAIQVHGGVGNTWECPAHLFLRRALVSTDVLGGVGDSLDRVVAHYGIGAVSGLR